MHFFSCFRLAVIRVLVAVLTRSCFLHFTMQVSAKWSGTQYYPGVIAAHSRTAVCQVSILGKLWTAKSEHDLIRLETRLFLQIRFNDGVTMSDIPRCLIAPADTSREDETVLITTPGMWAP